MRDGVGASRVSVPAGSWPDLASFLAERLDAVSLDGWRQRLARGDVLDADGRPLPADAPCRAHQTLWYWRQLDAPEPLIPFEHELLHHDARLLAVDKPHFLPMTPKGRHLQQTLLVRLKRQLGLETLVPIHRLDRETAGVVLFSVDPATRPAYQALFRERQVVKVYEAIAPWRADLPLPLERSSRLEQRTDAFMQMQELPGEPNAHTRIELIERLGGEPDRARYRLWPHTGRKHQLRAQLSALGLPIEGDRIYPQLQPEPSPSAEPDWSGPLQLLARAIEFTDPVSGERRRFESRRTLSP
ncbi:23S rRNA-/tRNA-specific pseudouridylate synthase [Sphaerotilus hippei]|uniref:23S rRNA-/tRNA-specific pseudouridylate synthase n=1 Tax=Sphaerotilus hippei TaxID=744406 RepID=A0A318H913_9BURK|nr:pseudouridine synthase [Sphaerotilus hippei]PXW99408.1 23S rRNA-/tRNA-specific pseudouridylate synthase [Sphaerotilus hippei]